jgi:hypothetical protein
VSEEAADLVPVFMPPLALSLASAEQKKGSRLTESEVLRLRDKSPCIMMQQADAAKLIETRGFRDVEPENCWADWHRLRVELTGDGFLPKLVVCVLGDADLPKTCGPILEGVEHEWQGPDPWMKAAFNACQQRVERSLAESDWQAIAEHQQVLYILSGNYSSGQAPKTCQKFLDLARRLLEAGATAVKCESSGVAHGKSRWIELAQEVQQGNPLTSLFRAFVQYPIRSDEGDLFTCGMHLLGYPDLIFAESLSRQTAPETDPGNAAVDLFLGFALYLIAECGEGKFHSGHTFSLDADSPRYRLIWEACSGYEEDDFFFNPFGRWRFTSV